MPNACGKPLNTRRHFLENHVIVTEQNGLQFALGVASTLAMLKTDVDTRIAAILFELTEANPLAAEKD